VIKAVPCLDTETKPGPDPPLAGDCAERIVNAMPVRDS
jgi:hypothetical protein